MCALCGLGRDGVGVAPPATRACVCPQRGCSYQLRMLAADGWWGVLLLQRGLWGAILAGVCLSTHAGTEGGRAGLCALAAYTVVECACACTHERNKFL